MTQGSRYPSFLRPVPPASERPGPSLRPRADEGGPSDGELVAALRSGDGRVAGLLHDRVVSAVDQALYRVVGMRDVDHDDLMQASFEQLVRSLVSGGFLGECSLRTWASRIATHVALNALRSKIRERKVILRGLEAPDLPNHPNEERVKEASSELVRVRRHLAEMNSAQSEVLVLHDVHGYGLNDIAALLGLTVAATQSRLVRGRKDLRDRLDRDKKRYFVPGRDS